MARNGSGVYSVYTPGNPVVNGTTIDPTAFNNTINDIATALTNSVARNGEGVPTANWPMATFKLTGLGAGTVAGDSLSVGQSAPGMTFTTNVVGTNFITGSDLSTTAARTGYTGSGANGPAWVYAGLTNGTLNGQLYAVASDGSTQFSVTPTLGATRNLQITGSVAGNPTITASGGSIALGSAVTASALITASAGINTAAADNTGLGIAISRSKSATTSRSSVVVRADDPHLIAPLSVGTWAIDLWVPVWGTTSGAQGFSWIIAFSGTATSSSYGNTGWVNGASASNGTGDITHGFAFPTIIVGLGVQPADWVRAQGTITVTVAGNLSLQWSQNSSTVNATNVGIGGWLNCVKVA